MKAAWNITAIFQYHAIVVVVVSEVSDHKFDLEDMFDITVLYFVPSVGIYMNRILNSQLPLYILQGGAQKLDD
jgi:hypothetical protein